MGHFPASAANSLIEGYCDDFVSLAAILAQTLERAMGGTVRADDLCVTLREGAGESETRLRLEIAKLAAALVIILPMVPLRLKEWAYAGMFFDLTGAVFSGLSVGGFDPQMLIMLVPFGLGALSYIYHHKRL